VQRGQQGVALRVGADGDAQELLDPRLAEVPHDDAAFAQLCGERCRIALRMPCEDEVGGGRQYLETEGVQRRHQPSAARDDLVAARTEIRVIFKRRHGADDREAIERVRVEAVLHALQCFYQIRVARREPDPQAGKRARLRQRLYHQQVGEAADQADRALAAKVDIGFVDDHDRIGVVFEQAFDFAQGQQTPGRRVRIRENDPAVGAADVIIDTDAEMLIERHDAGLDAVQPAIDRVEAVGDVREKQRRVVLEERHECVGQHLVRAVANEHLGRRDAVVRSNRRLQPIGVRVRIQAQRVVRLSGDRGQRSRAWAVGVLVGIELDQVGQLGLFARYVRRQASDDVTPETAHGDLGEWKIRGSWRACNTAAAQRGNAIMALRSQPPMGVPAR